MSSQSRLPETQAALNSLRSDRQIMFGLHEQPALRSGVTGRYVADVEFDPAVHDPSAINPLSVWEDITGEEQVSLVVPYRPLQLSIIRDETGRADLPKFAASKSFARNSLSSMLRSDAVPHTDRATEFLLGDQLDVRPYDRRTKDIEVGDRSQAAVKIADVARKGLALIISDFQDVDFGSKTLNDTIAIKLNHPSERFIPNNVGWLSLGSYTEINTDKPKQVEAASSRLYEIHLSIVSRLESAGAKVVSLVTDMTEPDGFDVGVADQLIADAIGQISERHK